MKKNQFCTTYTAAYLLVTIQIKKYVTFFMVFILKEIFQDKNLFHCEGIIYIWCKVSTCSGLWHQGKDRANQTLSCPMCWIPWEIIEEIKTSRTQNRSQNERCTLHLQLLRCKSKFPSFFSFSFCSFSLKIWRNFVVSIHSSVKMFTACVQVCCGLCENRLHGSPVFFSLSQRGTLKGCPLKNHISLSRGDT